MAEERKVTIDDEQQTVNKEIASFKERVLNLQTRLNCPKNRVNEFGDFNYRSCEDILMAAKPLLKELEIILTIKDSLEITEKENYIKATATLLDVHSTKSLQTIAYARETNEKKKMDAAQLTGSASSYARKYALNGLLCIDDNQDIDSMDNTNDSMDNAKQSYTQIVQNKSSSNKKNEVLQELLKWATNEDKQNKISIVIAELFHKKNYSELTIKESEQLLSEIQKIDEAEKMSKGTQQWM